MNLMQRVQSFFKPFFKEKPRYEVPKEIYYSRHLKPEDEVTFQKFIKDFTSKLKLDVAILAVGSSTYPIEYWGERRKLGEESPESGIPTSYEDIDLVIVPQSVIERGTLELAVNKVLSSLKLEKKLKEITVAGTSWHKQDDGTYCSFVHFDYGNHSISTKLPNGREVDLIIGRHDLIEKTAGVKLSEERKGNYAFSLLYPN